MRILHVEDDFPFAKHTGKALKVNLDADIEIDHVQYEKHLLEYLRDNRIPRVDLVLLDVMVAYQPPTDRQSEPKDVEDQGYSRAGVRALIALQSDEAYSKLPVILHSNLPEETLSAALEQRGIDPRSLKIVTKGADDNLVNAIRELIANRN